MPIKESIPETSTHHVGVFSLRQLQILIRSFLGDEEYFVFEPGYENKVGGDGAELVLELKADKKVDAYAKFIIEIKIVILEMNDVEVVRDGQKQKMQQGRVKIGISGEVELDYAKRFEKTSFLQSVRKVYHKYILNNKINKVYKYEVGLTIFKLHRAIRNLLQFEAR